MFETSVAAPLLVEPVYDGEEGPSDQPWARVSASIASRVQISCGVRSFRCSGIATIQLYFPASRGESDVAYAVEATLRAYTSHKTNGVRWRDPAQPIKNPNEKWLQWNVICPFEYEEHES